MVMTGDELRKAYLDFAEGHLILLSALCTKNDPSIFGLMQGWLLLRHILMGLKNHRRIATTMSGQMIENVGRTNRHLLKCW